MQAHKASVGNYGGFVVLCVCMQPWHRFEMGPEGDSAWASFSEFLVLSPRPTVEEFARSKSEPGTVLRWSMQWAWDARIAEFDAWTSQSGLRKNFPVAHPAILAVMRMCVAELKKYEAAQKESQFGFFTMGDCLRMLKAVQSAERDIARLETEIKVAQEQGAPKQDFSRLSTEEMSQLDALLAKVSL